MVITTNNMGFISNLKGFFRTKSQAISRSDFGLVSKLFGRQWSDKAYLETYGKSLYVYACVSKIAEKVGSIDFVLNKTINSKGDVEEVKDHPVLDLLYRVNPFFTKAEFLETDVINRKLTGDSYILKIRNNGGQVVELWNIRPDLVTIKSNPETYIDYYAIQREDGGQEQIAPEDMIHIKYPSPLDSMFGVSPLSCAQSRVDTEEYATKFQRDFFINNARPDAIIEMEGTLTPTQKDELNTGWEKKHKGLDKNSKIGVLSGGAKYHQISLSQREMDFIESMKFTRDDILVAFKVPKPIVAITDDVNRANAETAMDIFLSETIIPEVKKFVEKFNEELVIPDFGEEYSLSFVDPVPVNRETQLAEFVAGVDKWVTVNEIRQRIGLEPIDGGDTLFRPMAVEPLVGTIGKKPKSFAYRSLHGKRALKTRFKLKDNFIEEIKRVKAIVKKKVSLKGEISTYSLFSDKGKRKQYWEYTVKNIDKRSQKMKALVTKIKNIQRDEFIKRIAEQKPGTKTEIRKVFDIKTENEKFRDVVIPLYISIFKEAGEDAMSFLRVDKPFTIEKANVGPIIYTLLKARAMLFAKSVNNTTLTALTATLADGIDVGEGISKLKGRIKDVYTDFTKYRSELIARTETNAVVNEANLEAYDQSGVVQWKEWIATLDDRVRDEHLAMDGEIVKKGSKFSNGLDYPNEPNCRCAVAPVVNYVKE